MNSVSRPAHSVVILTRSGDSITGFLKDGTEVSVPIERTDVVDTIGAGDTFNAGILARLTELGLLVKESLAVVTAELIRDAIGFGARVATITVSRSGANPPWRNEI